jgi:predicted acyl esterase
MHSDYDVIMRPGVDPSSAPNKPHLPPADYVRSVESGLQIERNVAIPLRDGTRILCDIYRTAGPAGGNDLPTLLSWSPYGKHARSNNVFWPASGVNPDWLSPLTPFEGPDPVEYCGFGYAVVVVDPRGAWLSQGDYRHNGPVEAQDCSDTVAWLADRPWSNGKVGMTGVSYLAAIQYYVGQLNPPALAALNPCEGFSDWYRDFAYHGGIPETGFAPRASDSIQFSLHRTENTWANIQAHPLIDDYWRSKDVELEAIRIPVLAVAGWADHGLHLRGTLEAYKRIGSTEKWLDIHGQKKWAHYYLPENRTRRRCFFDHFLKQRDTIVPAWPKVRMEVREQAGKAEIREASEWPLARAQTAALWLGESGQLTAETPSRPLDWRHDAQHGRTVFDHRFAADTEISGHAKLRLWIEIDKGEDADIFVALQKLDAEGHEVGFTYYAFFENGPVTLGWLRASHRALDPMRSTELQPFHPHDREEPLRPGKPVALDIELWPSSTLFRVGETLRLVVAGSDIYSEGLPRLPFARHETTRNAGTHRILSGPSYDSHLLVPIVPPRLAVSPAEG